MGDEWREFNRICREMDDLYHEVAQKAGLSDSAFYILYTLLELGEGCLQIDIANRYFISKQTVHSAIRSLEQRGYISLQPGKKRDMHVYLTPSGEQFARQTIEPVIEVENHVFSLLTPQESQAFLQLNRRYTELLKENLHAFLQNRKSPAKKTPPESSRPSACHSSSGDQKED